MTTGHIFRNLTLDQQYETIDELFIYLGTQGYTGTINDRMFMYLRDLGHAGTLSEMLYAAIQDQEAGGGTFDPATEADYWFDPTDNATITLATGVQAWAAKGTLPDGARNFTENTASVQPLLGTKNSLQVMQMFDTPAPDPKSFNSCNITDFAYLACAGWFGDQRGSDTTLGVFGTANVGGAGSGFLMPLGQSGSVDTEWERNFPGSSIARNGVDVTPTTRGEAFTLLDGGVGYVWEFNDLDGDANCEIDTLGKTGGANYQSYGYIGDVIIMKTMPDAATRARIRTYLADRWGL